MQRSGYNTKQRRLIIDFLKENKSNSVSAKELHGYLIENETKVNITTVYRLLDKLVKKGELMKFTSDDGKSSCYKYVDDTANCHEHLHLKCSQCGKIVHLDCDYMEDIIKHISNCHNFDLRCENSVLYGKCKDCKSSKN